VKTAPTFAVALRAQTAVTVGYLFVWLLAVPAIAQETASQVTPEAASPKPAQPQAAAPAAPTPTAAPAPTVVMTGPRVTSFEVDWTAARATLGPLDQLATPRETADANVADALVRLNEATAKILPKAATSSVPVLLPFDITTFVRDRAPAPGGDAGKYFLDFHSPTFFYPGPSGYDAAFSVRPQDMHGVDAVFARSADIQISASTVVYELDGPPADPGTPVPALERDFPGIRRVILESRLRYIFTRFNVPYFVSITCNDGPKSARLLACREADQIAVRFLKDLTVVGGSPGAAPAKTAASTPQQPAATSPDFTYGAPGDILPGTGMKGQGGRADATVYATIRFPIAHAPAYINSQSFMNWGNCDLTGRVALGGRGRDQSYRCRVNDVPLFNDETRNYAYPWRDNFCEHRYWEVTQCPAGLGHQGEDIRPSACKLRNEDADRCEPYQDDVVAVRDGMVARNPGDEALYLIAEAPGERLRFRYLHMNPAMYDVAGLVNGRELHEGDTLGPVGDYGRREGGTTYHLHFDLQVLTRQGWLYVNPYMTLVSAYERLIGGRGRAVAVSASNSPPPGAGVGTGAGAEQVESKSPGKSGTKGDDKHRGRASAIEHCQTRVVKGHRRHVCWTDAAAGSDRASDTQLRGVDRGVPQQGGGPWHHAGDLHARHGRNSARHDRA
jgi:hypothetical protein